MQKIIHADLSQLKSVVEYMRSNIPKNAIISLNGDLAAGKTTLVDRLLKYCGVKGGAQSPTFSLQHQQYGGIFHYDFYMKSFEEIFELGLFEEFEKPGWHLVEWMSERMKDFFKKAGFELWEVKIVPHKKVRTYTIGRLDA